MAVKLEQKMVKGFYGRKRRGRNSINHEVLPVISCNCLCLLRKEVWSAWCLEEILCFTVNSDGKRMFHFRYWYMDLIIQAQFVRGTTPPYHPLYIKCTNSVPAFVFSIHSSLNISLYRLCRKNFTFISESIRSVRRTDCSYWVWSYWAYWIGYLLSTSTYEFTLCCQRSPFEIVWKYLPVKSIWNDIKRKVRNNP